MKFFLIPQNAPEESVTVASSTKKITNKFTKAPTIEII